MLDIDKNSFMENLRITQAYCALQLIENTKDITQVFRSFNPDILGKSLFWFTSNKLNFFLKPSERNLTFTKWEFDPIVNSKLIDALFIDQLDYKKNTDLSFTQNKNEGKILVADIDCTVIDGASEVESLGLIDLYDMPPIDTWFYILPNEKRRLLFAWIPAAYTLLANTAIAVNCIDCLAWFEDAYPKDFEKILF